MINIPFNENDLAILDKVLDSALKRDGLLIKSEVDYIIGKARKAQQDLLAEQESKEVVEKVVKDIVSDKKQD